MSTFVCSFNATEWPSWGFLPSSRMPLQIYQVGCCWIYQTSAGVSSRPAAFPFGILKTNWLLIYKNDLEIRSCKKYIRASFLCLLNTQNDRYQAQLLDVGTLWLPPITHHPSQSVLIWPMPSALQPGKGFLPTLIGGIEGRIKLKVSVLFVVMQFIDKFQLQNVEIGNRD